MDREVGGGAGRQEAAVRVILFHQWKVLTAHLLRKVYVPVLVGEVDVPVAEEPGQSQEADPVKKNGANSPLVSVRPSVRLRFISVIPS